jgi:hypothetical protein
VRRRACTVCQIVCAGEAAAEEENTDTVSSRIRSNGLSSGKGVGLLRQRRASAWRSRRCAGDRGVPDPEGRHGR